MSKPKLVERHLAVKAYISLVGSTMDTEDADKVLNVAHKLVSEGHDRFSIVQHLLEQFGHTKDALLSSRMLATLSRRHQTASDRLDEIGTRTPQNATRYDGALAEEIALNNALHAVIDDAELEMSTVLRMAGLDYEAGEALLSLTPDKRLRYEQADQHAAGFARLIELGLALNISSHFSGGSLGVALSDAGEIVWRLVTGIRKLPRASSRPTALAA